MSRQRNQADPETGWRALILAAGIAAGVLLLLVASVGVIWLVGRSPSSAPALGVQPLPTPTPRSLAFLRETPTPSAPGALSATAESGADPQQPEPASPSVSSTPAMLDMRRGDEPGATGNGAVLSAPEVDAFDTLASGSWRATADALQNDGTNANAEPWLRLATFPESAFAIEAEIRVNGLLDTFCNQSFGLVGGDPAAGQVFGGGVLFPCEEEDARARLTEVSVWQDGYRADPLIAETAFDPGDDWRTYRFEVRGDTIRLIVDGVGIVSGPLETTLEAPGGAEAGIWSQGVDLDVHRIEIVPLPAS